MSVVLELADRLRHLSDEDLAGLLRERSINPNHLRDFFDLAEVMLQTKSAEAWLSSLNLDQLRDLASKRQSDSTFSEISTLVLKSASSNRAEFGEKFREYLSSISENSKVDKSKHWDAEASTITANDATAGFSQEAGASPDLDQAAMRIFETTQAMTEIIYHLEQHLVRSVGKTGVASSELKRLSAHLSLDVQRVRQLFELAGYCDLVALETDRWALTESSRNWLSLDTSERWKLLAKYWLLMVGSSGVSLFRSHWKELETETFGDFLVAVYPLGSKDEDSRANRIKIFAEAIGLTESDRATKLFETVIVQKFDAALVTLQKHLPKVQDRVIVQADLSIVTPGPLSSEDERALRAFVETEQIGIASRLRLTPLSLTVALESGLTLDEIRSTLLRLSQGNLPQPVEYLLADTAKRFGRIRVLDDIAAGVSRVECADEFLATEILHQSALRPFAFTKLGPNTLTTKYESELVYFGLREVGHLAIRVDSEGSVISPMKTASIHNIEVGDTIAATIERLRLADSRVIESGDDESMLRQIQLAMKNRATVRVSYRGKDGVDYEFTLEPTGLANGRLRGKDKRADIERTLTLANITKLSMV